MNFLTTKEARYFGLSPQNLYFTLLIITFYIVSFYFIFQIDNKRLLKLLTNNENNILLYFQMAIVSALAIACFYAYQTSKRMSFLFLSFVWVAHIFYKLFTFSVEKIGSENDKVFLIGIIALVADLPLFLGSFSDKHRKWWISFFPIITFISMVIVYNLEGMDVYTKKRIVYIYSPLQSFFILIWLFNSTIFHRIFSNSKKLSKFLAVTFVGLAISQTPFIYEGFSNVILTSEEKLPWKRFTLGILLYTLIIVLFIIRDEFRKLDKEKEQLFNEKNKVEEKLEVKGEFEDLGYLAASIEHELRNPLEVLKREIDTLKDKFQNEDKSVRDKFDSLEVQSDRISLAANIIRILRLKKEDFAHKLIKETLVIDRINAAIKYIKKEFPPLSEKIHIKVNEKVKELYIRAFSPYLEQTFVNLLKNSYEALDKIPKGGQIIIDLYLIDKDTVGITFCDTGGGFVIEDIPNLTSPNYTKKDSSRSESNRGLGLFVCDKIVNLHNGKISFSNAISGGAEVKLEFPRHFSKKQQRTQSDNNQHKEIIL